MDRDDGLVLGQMVALAALGWPGAPRWRLPRAVGAVAASAMVGGGLLALAGVRPHGRLLTPRVAPPTEGELHRHGAYAVSRHPIYTGLITATAGWVVLRRRPEPVAAWAALVAVLDAKTRREERLLVERFGDQYLAYRARTPRLLVLPTRPAD